MAPKQHIGRSCVVNSASHIFSSTLLRQGIIADPKSTTLPPTAGDEKAGDGRVIVSVKMRRCVHVVAQTDLAENVIGLLSLDNSHQQASNPWETFSVNGHTCQATVSITAVALQGAGIKNESCITCRYSQGRMTYHLVQWSTQ